MSRELVLAVAIAYLLALFAIAFVVERSTSRLGKLTGSSLVYTLSLAVYCSSWTFNGGVGRAAQNGFDFLPIYLGPTLAFILGPILIRRMLRISKANKITSRSSPGFAPTNVAPSAPLKPARRLPSAKTITRRRGTLVPMARAISSSSTAARMRAPISVRSVRYQSANAISGPIAIRMSRSPG